MDDETNQAGMTGEMAALTREVALLNRHRFVVLHNSPIRLLVWRFAGGLAFGLGTVVGASLVVSILIYALSSIDFIPVIGDWAASIAQEMQAQPD